MKNALATVTIVLLAGCTSIGTQGNVDVVRIDADGKTSLNGKLMPLASLSDSFKSDEVVIDANRSTPHNEVTAVMVETKEAGITKVSFKTHNDQK